MDNVKLFDSEYHFAEIVWEQEPVGSGVLAKLAAQRLGWKKSTAYTVLKKLCDRGILQNEDSTVTARVTRAQADHARSREAVAQGFDGSLPKFVTAFLGDGRLSAQEAEELRRLIDRSVKEGS